MTQNEIDNTTPPVLPEIPTPVQPANTGNKNMIMASLAILILLVVVVSYFSFHTKTKTTVKNTVATTQPAKIAPAAVNISSTSFSPTTVYIKTGQAVVWTNMDTNIHTIASDNPKPVFQSNSLSANDSFSYIFNKAGTYPYHDNANTRLAGIIVVKQ